MIVANVIYVENEEEDSINENVLLDYCGMDDGITELSFKVNAKTVYLKFRLSELLRQIEDTK